MKLLYGYVLLTCCCLSGSMWGQVLPIPCGHAHNDYAQHRPLLSAALQAGMTSIEVDVYPRRGKLCVAHLPLFLGGKIDLEEGYFKPLNAMDTLPYPLILMIDIKDRSEQAYVLIRELAERYSGLVTWFDVQGRVARPGRVELLLSGSKPWQAMAADTLLPARMDAGPDRLGSLLWTAALAPRLSLRYPFRWRGRGAMPEREQALLRDWVQKTHDDGRQLRFWAIPQRPAVWEALLDAGVDWLNIDNVRDFSFWWKNR